MLCEVCGKREATRKAVDMTREKKTVVRICANCAKEKGWEEVVAALGRIGGAQVIRALEEALSDAAFQVRWAARKALRGLEEQ